MKKTLSNSSRLAVSPNAPVAKKGTCLVRCTNHPKLAYEYLIKFIDGKAIIGGKRAVKIDFSANGSGTPISDISGEVELINGMTWACVHCDNGTIVKCGSCDCWSCEVKGSSVSSPCPYCGIHGNIHIVSSINATPKAETGGLPSKPKTSPKTTIATNPNIKRLK